MNIHPARLYGISVPASRRRQSGFSLIELMVAIAISLLVVAGLVTVLVNLSAANRELSKANDVIENGRFALQILRADVMHAGYWGGYTPQFDDQGLTPLPPSDVPTAIPDPCLAYSPAAWDSAYQDNLLGIPLWSGNAAPGTCAGAGVVTNQQADTDVLVVRHAETCVPGDPNCDPYTAGKLYLQFSLCSPGTIGTAQAGTANTITLQAPTAVTTTSPTPNAYSGMMVRITGGTGAGQPPRRISSYLNNVATIATPWVTIPDSTSTYSIVEYLLDTTGLSLHQKGTSTCDLAPQALLHKFVSNIYWIRSFRDTPGDAIPTLVRSSFDPSGAPALAHQAPVVLVEGIQGFAVEVGIDNTVTRCNLNTPVTYGVPTFPAPPIPPVQTVSPTLCAADPTNPGNNTLPTNRGDGMPDTFVHCGAASACDFTQLRDVVAVKLYVLARSSEPTPGYTDTKTYCLGAIDAAGTCPATATRLGPFNDGYRRHVFSTTVRMVNVSSRRESAK